MKINLDNADAEFSYLSINGNGVAYDNAVLPKGMITGPLTSSNFTDPIASRNAKELALNLTVASGSGTLAVAFIVLDPMEPSNGTTGVSTGSPPALINLNLGGTLSAPGTLRFVIANGNAVLYFNGIATQLGTMNVPMFWQVQLQVGGTSPAISVIGTYETRR